MQGIELRVNAKINWALNVLNKREDGYHEVDMLLQSVDLFDTMTIEKVSSGITLSVGSAPIPSDYRNIAWRAAESLRDRYPHIGVKIKLIKRIPVAAGLAGGSADAAAVLYGMNRLFELGLSLEKLQKIAISLGADVPFCLQGGCMRARGIGELLTPCAVGAKFYLVLVKPPFAAVTRTVYEGYSLCTINERPKMQEMMHALAQGDKIAVGAKLCNVLENVTAMMYPEIEDVKAFMIQYGALGSAMSGSGSTVFGLFASAKEAKQAREKLKIRYPRTYVVATQPKGIVEVKTW